MGGERFPSVASWRTRLQRGCAALAFLAAVIAGGACDLLPPRDLQGEGDTRSTTLDDMVAAARNTEAAKQGLQPLARFIGDWEGSSDSLRGTLRVTRRLSWLVEGSWLVEQTVVRSADGGEEVSRGGALYRWDPQWKMIVATSFGAGGTATESWMQLSDDGHTFEIRAVPDSQPHSLFQTTLFNGVDWHSRVYDLDPAGTWNQAERMSLRKME